MTGEARAEAGRWLAAARDDLDEQSARAIDHAAALIEASAREMGL